MADGIEIFKQLTLKRNPEREVEKLNSEDLAALITELQGKRWSRSFIAGVLLDRAVDNAVGRFVTEVNMK